MEIKISIIGGGSRGWAMTIFKDLAATAELSGTINLYDIDHAAARENEAYGNRVFTHPSARSGFKVNYCPTAGAALEGADFVIFSIEPGPIEMRYYDLVLPEKYHILQSVGDTTGPGGWLRARRSIPIFRDYARLVMRYCPRAWVINYTNPMTLCTWALYQEEPRIKAIGCCHEVFHTQHFLARLAAQWFQTEEPDRREIELDICGVNHFTFALKARWQDRDLYPHLLEMLKEKDTFKDLTSTAKARRKKELWFESDNRIALDFLKNFGALGAAGDRHLAEFVPWYLQADKSLHRFGVIRTPYEWRVRIDKGKKKKKYTAAELVPEKSGEEGVEIIKALAGLGTLTTNINFPNSGQIPWLPDHQLVETNARLSRDKIEPVKTSPPPGGIKMLVSRIAALQKLVLDGVFEENRAALFQAFLADPLMTIPIEKAEELFTRLEEAYETHKMGTLGGASERDR